MARSNAPRIESGEAPTEGFADLTLPSTGGIESAIAQSGKTFNSEFIEPAGPMAQVNDKIAMLAFYAEKMEIIIQDNSDENPETFVYLSVNGRGAMPNGDPWVPRNVPIVMARMFVEVLARAKPVALSTHEATDPLGYKTTKIRRASTPRYPFTVLRDDNPRGSAWLREVLRQK